MSGMQNLKDMASNVEEDNASLPTALMMPFGRLSVESEEVRKLNINWQSYVKGQMINQEDYAMIAEYDLMGVDERGNIIETKGFQLAKTCLSLLARLSVDQTIRYILVLIDDMITEEKSRVSIFHEFGKRADFNVWGALLKFLNRQDQFIVHQTALIVVKLASWGKVTLPDNDLNYFLTWIKNSLGNYGSDYQHSVAQCLQLLLRHNSYRQAFFKLDGIQRGNAVIRVLADILRESGKEKVTRIIIATLRNLLEKPEERKNDAALSMVQCKLLPEDVEIVYEKLNERVQDLSTFDEYAAERENAQRLNENNFELLKTLTRLMDISTDPIILAVAAHDTGEYVRHYPRGKHVLENLGCKVMVMRMMTHNDASVRKEALLAVQKLMVHNWEYLGKQLKVS
ncbi:V-type proton ATPase subunit H [Acropora cervicornis]|uniref:V-type proton ATPase subunit H n=1 Tax=Acropora cervicornis TaxID=6130 RepID=A0AAD9PYU0_ACRCE|nr:V-type proton ATPase subunit H [Acropora cervicornis]